MKVKSVDKNRDLFYRTADPLANGRWRDGRYLDEPLPAMLRAEFAKKDA